jgi:polyhydroxyalkanoate synthesis regulator phasin
VVEPQDAIFPVLQKIQREQSELRKYIEGRLDEISEVLGDHGDRLRKIEANTAFHRGMTLQHQFELDTLRRDVDALKSRVAVLEEKT